MTTPNRSPLYELAHAVVEAYPEGGARLADAVDRLDRELNEIDRSLRALDDLRATFGSGSPWSRDAGDSARES